MFLCKQKTRRRRPIWFGKISLPLFVKTMSPMGCVRTFNIALGSNHIWMTSEIVFWWYKFKKNNFRISQSIVLLVYYKSKKKTADTYFDALIVPSIVSMFAPLSKTSMAKTIAIENIDSWQHRCFASSIKNTRLIFGTP